MINLKENRFSGIVMEALCWSLEVLGKVIDQIITVFKNAGFNILKISGSKRMKERNLAVIVESLFDRTQWYIFLFMFSYDFEFNSSYYLSCYYKKKLAYMLNKKI